MKLEYELNVCVDGVVIDRPFDPEQEGVEALGEALSIKDKQPEAVVTLLVTPAPTSAPPRGMLDLYADESEPTSKLVGHIYRVEIPPDKRTEHKTSELPFIYAEVDPYGMINIAPRSLWFGQTFEDMGYGERRDVYEWLIEWDFCFWGKIGPEDNELFATSKLSPEFGIDR